MHYFVHKETLITKNVNGFAWYFEEEIGENLFNLEEAFCEEIETKYPIQPNLHE